jgi:hypothetical protein
MPPKHKEERLQLHWWLMGMLVLVLLLRVRVRVWVLMLMGMLVLVLVLVLVLMVLVLVLNTSSFGRVARDWHGHGDTVGVRVMDVWMKVSMSRRLALVPRYMRDAASSLLLSLPWEVHLQRCGERGCTDGGTGV